VPGLVSVWLHGSARSVGQAGDVDLALFAVPGAVVGVAEAGRFAAEVARALGPGAPPLDVRVMHGNGLELAHEVLTHGELLWQSDADERAWVEATFASAWLDAQWLHTVADAARRDRDAA